MNFFNYMVKCIFIHIEYDINHLESTIAEMKEKIKIREERITTRATTLLKRSPVHDFQAVYDY